MTAQGRSCGFAGLSGFAAGSFHTLRIGGVNMKQLLTESGYEPADNTSKIMRKVRTTVLVWITLGALAVLAIPVGILMLLISQIWSGANEVIGRMESGQKPLR